MRSLVGSSVAFASMLLLITLDIAPAMERKGRQAKMSAQERQFILRAFAAAAPEAGEPEIVAYPDGAYIANAARGRVQVYVRRSAEGVVTAQYTTTGTKAARGVATADRIGSGASQTLFGPDGDRSAEYTASRLARTLAPPIP